MPVRIVTVGQFLRPRRPPARMIAAGTLAGLYLVCAAPAAWSDAAAGRRAYEKGDYTHAMAEWQSAADRGDAAAEFGLGNLYEFGAGDLKQDYKQADFWYRRAAAQGNAAAQYRLALIWAVGGDNFPPDLVEAYKWDLLAAQSNGVWSTLARDLMVQLNKVVSDARRAEAKARADAWEKARAEKAQPVASAATRPGPPPATAGKPAKGGCPGWPFPTLPCTEKFPAIPGLPAPPPTAPLPAPRVAASPAGTGLAALDKAIAGIDCAALHTRISPEGTAVIAGTVPDAAQRVELARLAARLVPGRRSEIKVEVLPFPVCRWLLDLKALSRAGLADGHGLALRLAGGGAHLRQGEPIRIEVRGPAHPVDLRIDYYSLDGRVLHLWPNSEEPRPHLSARGTHVFGTGPKLWSAGGPPFGTELIATLASPHPIDFGGARPKVEMAADYLRDLKRVLARRRGTAGPATIVATLLVKTSAR